MISSMNLARRVSGSLLAIALLMAAVQVGFADNNKSKKGATAQVVPAVDLSKLAWPPPPDVTRIRYITLVKGEEDINPSPKKKRNTFLDKMAGVSLPSERGKPSLQKPYGIAVDSKGQIYVADPGHAAIFVFDLEGKKVTYRGIQQLTSPAGLAIDDADRLFVSDAVQHVILCFRPDGSLEGSFGQQMLSKPVGIALDPENRYVYVVDSALNKVFVYDSDNFSLLRSFGKKSDATLAPGTFDRPTNIALDSDYNVYVVDTFNNRIQVFDADGQYLRMFGKQGNIAGTFMRPKGIAVDSDNHVYVVDSEFNNIQVFDSDGRILMFFGSRGDAPGSFTLASGIAIDHNNRVIVDEQWKGRVQVFKYISDEEARPAYEKLAAEQDAKREAEEKAAEAEKLKINGSKKD